MSKFIDGFIWGAGFTTAACIIWFVIFPWIRSW